MQGAQTDFVPLPPLPPTSLLLPPSLGGAWPPRPLGGCLRHPRSGPRLLPVSLHRQTVPSLASRRGAGGSGDSGGPSSPCGGAVPGSRLPSTGGSKGSLSEPSHRCSASPPSCYCVSPSSPPLDGQKGLVGEASRLTLLKCDLI